MKNRLIVTAFLMLPVWAACAPFVPSEKADLKILATNSIIADVVQNVAGRQIEIGALLPSGSDPHSFAPTPRDIVAIEEADLLFVNGLGLEDSLEDFLQSTSEATIIISLSEGIELENSDDPHVWMNPKNVSQWVDRIAFELSSLDPAHSAAYQANAEAYKAELDSFDEWAEAQITALDASERMLLSDHESLTHFALRYDFEILGTLISGASTLSEASASSLAELENSVTKYNLAAIFVGSPGSEDLAAQFAADTGVQVVALFVEFLSGPNGPANTYLEMMRYDVNAITKALK